MKQTINKITIMTILMMGLFFVGSIPVAAQVLIGKSGVGESGASSLLVKYGQVTGNKGVVVVLRNVETTLFGNTGAIAVLVVNGEPVNNT